VTLYLEDLHVGDVFDLGRKTVTADEIVRFAREFDPQPFHIDPVAARDSTFGGLVASGWHTSSIFGRLLVDSLFNDVANLAGLGIDEVRFLGPVRPGDTLSGKAALLEARRSRSHAERGVVRLSCELVNQRDELVWSALCASLVRSRA
jgi:acyl dehydratase